MENFKSPVDVNNMTESEIKHVPHIEVNGNQVTVRCGSTINHAMDEVHHIEWIELRAYDDTIIGRKDFDFNVDKVAEVTFTVENTDGIYALEYCNLHGLWRSL